MEITFAQLLWGALGWVLVCIGAYVLLVYRCDNDSTYDDWGQ